MFTQIKTVVDIVMSGFKSLREFKTKYDRNAAVTDMLRFYFFLKDCVDEGEALIVEAGSNPVAKLAALAPQQAAETAARWDRILRRQGIRLRSLEGLLFGQSHLTVIDPALEESLSKAIGYKMNQTVTLHGIGAALFLRCMFPMSESGEGKAKLVALMAGERSCNTINLDRIRAEVTDLRAALSSYKAYIDRLASDDEIIQLSGKARDATRILSEH